MPIDAVRALVNQVARLSSVCEIYAPVYRQMTIGSRTQRMAGTADDAAMEAAGATTYGDVRDAFLHYLANDNDGRGVILIGHSQGANLLTGLIADEVDGNEAITGRLVAAYLIGSAVSVDEGPPTRVPRWLRHRHHHTVGERHGHPHGRVRRARRARRARGHPARQRGRRGDRLLGGGLPANWGLHLADVNLAMGELEALAAAQAEAYAER